METHVTTTPTTTSSERPWIAGVILIGIGLALLVAQLFQPTAWLVLGSLSVLFLALFAGTRRFGLLVLAMILGGLAVGVGLEDAGYSTNGSAVNLGLAGGFIAIFVAGALTGAPAHRWALIPGSILAVIGGSQAIGGSQYTETVERLWPLGLVAVGLVVLFFGRPGSTKVGPKT